MTKGEFEQLSFPAEEPKPIEVPPLYDTPEVRSDDQNEPVSQEPGEQMEFKEESERIHREHLAEMEESLERLKDIEISWPAKGGKPERVSLFDAFVSFTKKEFKDNKLIGNICEQRLLDAIGRYFPKTTDKSTLSDAVEALELVPLREKLKQVNDSIEEERNAWDRLQFSGRESQISLSIGRMQDRAESLEKQIKEREDFVEFLDDLAAKQSLEEKEKTDHERIKQRAQALEKAYRDVALEKLQKATVEKKDGRIPLEDLLADLYLESELPNLPFELEAENERKKDEARAALKERFTPEELRRLVDALGRESDLAEQQYLRSINVTTEPTEEELEKMARANEKRKKAYRKYKALSELIY